MHLWRRHLGSCVVRARGSSQARFPLLAMKAQLKVWTIPH